MSKVKVNLGSLKESHRRQKYLLERNLKYGDRLADKIFYGNQPDKTELMKAFMKGDMSREELREKLNENG